MKSRKLDTETVLIFDAGEEFASKFTESAIEHRISAAHFSAIGSFSDAEIGCFDWRKKDHVKNPANEQGEVISLIADIALDCDSPKSKRSCSYR